MVSPINSEILESNTGAEAYKQVCTERKYNFAEIKKADELVLNFIREKQLPLYGGTAIDYALKLRGNKLYAKTARPDFDFFSPNHEEDARELTTLIYNELSPDDDYVIKTKNAVHVGTIRVIVYDEPVADISIIDKEIYERLLSKYVLYWSKKLPIVSPIFQYIDLYSAIALPFQNSPMEVIFHRGLKDITRVELLQKYYPPKHYSGGKKRNADLKKLVPANHVPESGAVVCGATAYSVICKIAGKSDWLSIDGENDYVVNDRDAFINRDDSRIIRQRIGNMSRQILSKSGKLHGNCRNIFGDQILICREYCLGGKHCILIPSIAYIFCDLIGHFFITGNRAYLGMFAHLHEIGSTAKSPQVKALFAPYPLQAKKEFRVFGDVNISTSEQYKLSRSAQNIGKENIAPEYLIDLSKIPINFNPAKYKGGSAELSAPSPFKFGAFRIACKHTTGMVPNYF